jgi:hypothetical protein
LDFKVAKSGFSLTLLSNETVREDCNELGRENTLDKKKLRSVAFKK